MAKISVENRKAAKENEAWRSSGNKAISACGGVRLSNESSKQHGISSSNQRENQQRHQYQHWSIIRVSVRHGINSSKERKESEIKSSAKRKRRKWQRNGVINGEGGESVSGGSSGIERRRNQKSGEKHGESISAK